MGKNTKIEHTKYLQEFLYMWDIFPSKSSTIGNRLCVKYWNPHDGVIYGIVRDVITFREYFTEDIWLLNRLSVMNAALKIWVKNADDNVAVNDVIKAMQNISLDYENLQKGRALLPL